jgi:hypothetical protein
MGLFFELILMIENPFYSVKGQVGRMQRLGE